MNAVVQPTMVPAASPPTVSPPGPKILLQGDSGTGKSHSLRTLIDAGITPFVIATEQNFLQVTKGLPGTKLHYKFISARPEQSMDHILDMLKKVNALSYENLTKVADPFKQANNRFIDVAMACNEFKCDCCGKSWGNVMKWNTDRAFVIDSLSGLSDMAFNLVVGNKPVRAMPDYQVAQNALRMLIEPLTSQLRCTLVLVCHQDREKDEITGGTTITAKTVGQKLGPDLPRMFSDCIRAVRLATNYTWDTADSQATVVGRNIPIASGQPPSFVPLINNWKAQGGRIEATP